MFDVANYITVILEFFGHSLILAPTIKAYDNTRVIFFMYMYMGNCAYIQKS